MTRSFGLRAALTLLVLIAIAPVFGVVVQSSLGEQRARLARAQASLTSLVELSAAHQEGLVEGARQMLTAIAASPPIYDDDLVACTKYMEKLQLKYPRYANFGLLDAAGRMMCRALPSRNPIVADDRLYFRTAVETGRFAVGEFQIGRATGKPGLNFGMPVYREDTPVLRGVLVASLDLEQVNRQLGSIGMPPEVTLFVTDQRGLVLASAGANPQSLGSRLPLPFLLEGVSAGQARLAGASDVQGRDWRYAIQQVGRSNEGRLYVAAMMSSDDVLAPGLQRLYLQLAALLVITLLGAVAAWMFGDRVVARPIGRMLQRVDALRREELRLDAAEAPPALTELRELDERFQDMARGLAQRSAQRDSALAEMAGQKNLLESILASMAEGVIVIDGAGHFIHTNAAAHRIMPGLAELGRFAGAGGVRSAQRGLFHLEGVTPLAAQRWPALRALRRGKGDNFRCLVHGRLAGGVEKILQGHSRTLHSPQGEQCGAVLVFSDITADYRAEQALKASEQRYRSLFESNPHPMWVYDLETLRFLTVNDAAVAAYGYSREEFMGMTVKDIRPAEDVPALLRAVSTVERVHSPSLWRHRLKDGAVIFVEVSSHSLEYEGRKARMALAHDITQRRLAQQALEQLNGTLERRVEERTRALAISNQELESFAYSVSHDLRAPLQVIDGFSRALLSRYAQTLDSQARHYLHRIGENTRQMGELIDGLLSLAHVTRSEMRVEPINLAARAGQIIERLRLRDPHREVEVKIDDDIGCTGDPRLLAVVMENLIENAWKFTARAAAPRIRIGRMPGRAGESVIYVADNGAGFDMAYYSKLFNAFHRLHTSAEFEGNGIGLATVHRIVTRHGGRVWAESTPGRGAIFHFTLKGASDEEQPR